MNNKVMKIAFLTLTVSLLALAAPSFAYAQENSSGALTLRTTSIKTHSTILSLPKAPSTVDAFSATYVYCPPGGPCTLEINVTSELSDITPGTDSLRFVVTVDGSPIDMLPISNLAFNSTAKAGQIESGTGTWMRKNLAPGYHYVRVASNVSDSNNDGAAFGYIGDRTLVIRVYSNQVATN